MNKKAGIWIDHEKAVVVMLSREGESLKQIKSNMKKHVRFTDGSSDNGPGEDVRDRKFKNHLNTFYDEVITNIREAGEIQIFGPGEAKTELRKRIEGAGLESKILDIESTDKMTSPQVLAKVRKRFLL